MTLTITIKMDNAAFSEDNGAEVARILAKFAREVESHTLEPDDSYKLRDINGNTVGTVSVSE
jgi:hypothetical protein